MGYNEFDELGDKIQDIIDSAINEKNYQKLSQTINQALNKAIDNGSDALKDALNNTVGSGKYTNYRTGSSYDYRQNRSWEFQKEGNNQENERNRRNGEASGNTDANSSVFGQTDLTLYSSANGIRVKGLLKTVFGGILTGTFGIAAILCGALGIGFGKGAVLGVSAGLTVLTAASGLLLGQGCTTLAGLKRRSKYIDALGSHTYGNFQQLALAVDKPVKFVKKDIKRMIKKGWFLQGHVDKQETCLITSNETYEQYVSTQKQLEERQQKETLLRQQADESARRENECRQQAEERMRQEEKENLSPEVRQVLDKGNDFLEKIRRSNDAIPGEEISRKISRMELIVAKIFERAKAHPEIITDLNRLMDYYLPMTVKLLNAYEDMDSQPVQGENITSSKKEIEETIDTLNIAFEKLLDSVFADVAMDVSSDISVLNTVLAQEGLTEDELTRMRKKAGKE